MLIMRCREHKTEAIIVFDTYLGSSDVHSVLYRINDARPVEVAWHGSSTGRAVFASNAIPFIKSLPDGGKLFARAKGYGGSSHDAAFNLGFVGEARDRVAAACRWSEVNPAAKLVAPKSDVSKMQAPTKGGAAVVAPTE